MNHIYITLEEARRVVAALEADHERGFVASEAVLKMHGTITEGGWVEVKYSHLCHKAHPTDPSLNWGCFSPLDCRVVDGKLVHDWEDKCVRDADFVARQQ